MSGVARSIFRPICGRTGRGVTGAAERPFWVQDLQTGALLAYYKGDIIDGRLQAYRPIGSSTPQVKGSLFSVAVPEDVAYTGILTTDVITASGTAPTCAVNGTLSMSANFWDMSIHRGGVLWAYLPGINVGGAFEVDASGLGHHLYLTTTTIVEAVDGTGTNYANESGFSTSDGSTVYMPGIQSLESPGGDVHIGGLAQGSFLASTTLAAGSTYIQASITRRIQQTGPIKKVVLGVHTAGNFKVKVFRLVGSDYTFVGESETITAPIGTATYALSQPIPCLPGDYLGLYITTPAKIYVSNLSEGAASIRYTAGDITESNQFLTLSNGFVMNITAVADTPFMAVTGDSIAEGMNQGVWHGYFGGPAGDLNACIMHRLSLSIAADGKTFGNYRDFADGTRKWDWCLTTGIPACIASGASAIWIHVGVNDVQAGRTWAAVESDMDAIRALIPTETALYVDEILPWSDGTDVQNATIRLWNTYYAAWCLVNNATLVQCHDDMGQVRISTGEIDDLKTAYDYDGVHLSQVGVSAMAELWKYSLYLPKNVIVPTGYRVPPLAGINSDGTAFPVQYPGPLNVSATITAGTTYPAVTIKAPLGPKFQGIPEWTGEAAVDLSTLSATARTRIGPRGMLIYGEDLDATEQMQADRYLGVS